MSRLTDTPARIAQAAAHLRDGGVVAFPTETVYGLGADASNPAAVAQIFRLKGRPADHPLIVHIAGIGELERWAREIPPAARRLAERFWPGPLTLVLNKQPWVPDAVTGGQATVGLRVPAHPLALALLRAFGGGIAAPSANRFGRISPTSAAHVQQELGADFGLTLEGGASRVGVESTIIGFVDGGPVLLRPGGICLQRLEAVLGAPIQTAAPARQRIRASGMLAAHYAPQTAVEVLPIGDLVVRARTLLAQGRRVAIMARSRDPRRRAMAAGADWIEMPATPAGYARRLYAQLRELDASGVDRLLVQAVPASDAWRAIADRLQRAAAAHPA